MFHELYNELYKHYGDLQWWPSESDDETVIGCILTQNTSWSNVKKSIDILRENDMLDLKRIREIDETKLQEYIKSSGYYTIKTRYLKNIASSIIDNYNKLERMKNKDLNEIKPFIKNIKGVGNETMNSILLYALDYPVFVIDSYTLRLFKRYYGKEFASNDIKTGVEQEFDGNIFRLKNFHGMIVQLSKEYCKKKPECNKCFINNKCIYFSGNSK